MKRLPTAYIVLLGTLLAVGVLSALVFLGVPPFDSTQAFILGNVVGFFTLLIVGVVGGAFLGMLLAHRILANRQFTPFERNVLESLAEIRSRIDAMEKRNDDLARRR